METHHSTTGTPSFGIDNSFVLAQMPATPGHTSENGPSFGTMFPNNPQGGLPPGGTEAMPYGIHTMYAGLPGNLGMPNFGLAGHANTAANAVHAPENNRDLQEIINTVAARLERTLQASIDAAAEKPTHTEQLNPKDYPASVLWTQAAWKTYKKSTRGETNIGGSDLTGSRWNFRFLFHEDGSQITAAELDVLMIEARHCFANMDHTLGVDTPRTWERHATRATREAVYRELEAIFSYLRLCDSPRQWKSEQVVILLYPRWRANHAHPADLLKNKATEDTSNNRHTTVKLAAIAAPSSERIEVDLTASTDTETVPEESGPKRKSTEDTNTIARKRSKPIENVVVNNAMDNFFEQGMSTPQTGASSDEHADPTTNETENSPAPPAQAAQSGNESGLEDDCPATTPTPVHVEPAATRSSARERAVPTPATVQVHSDASASSKKTRGRAPQVYQPSQAVSGKNFYGIEWIKTNEGASKPTFEAAWKALSTAEKEPYLKAAKAQGTRGKKTSPATN